jgi:tetratricopeptide (TPR) repeat protein
MIRTDFEPEVGEMDPKLAEALNAFGSSRYDECRKLAEDLISASDDSSTRAECVGIIILSHLDQGDFDGARAAADRLRTVSPDVCQDLLQQVNREERDYNAEVSRLQQIVVSASNPDAAARAQLRTARVHQRTGRADTAVRSYYKVVANHSDWPEAGMAFRQLVSIEERSRGESYARQMCTWATESFPQSLPVMRAVIGCIARLAQLAAKQGRPLDDYRSLLAAFVAADFVPLRAEAQAALTDLDLTAGMEAHSRGEHRAAVLLLEGVLSRKEWHGDALQVAEIMGDSYQGLKSYTDAITAYERGLGTDRFEQKHLPVLFKIGKCQHLAGQYEDAIATFRSVAQHDQTGTLSSECFWAIHEVRNALGEQ